MKRLWDQARKAYMDALEPGGMAATVRGLVLKDIWMMVSSGKAFLFMCVGYCMIPGAWIKMAAACFVSMIPIYTMTLDEQSRWDRYALSLPVKRRDIVISKYVIGILGALLMFIILLTVGRISDLFMPFFPLGNKEIALIAGICLLLHAAIMPFQFRFGPTQGRFVQIIAYVLVMVLYLALINAGVWMRFTRWIPIWLLLFIGIGIGVVTILSICLAVRWYRERSF